MRYQMDKLWKVENNAKNIKPWRLDSFNSRAVLSNVDTHTHDDGHDQKDGMITTRVFGDLKKGEYVGQVPFSTGRWDIH